MSEILKFDQFKSINQPITQEYLNEGIEFIEAEIRKMRRDGMSMDQINENIFTEIFSKLGGGFSDILRNYIMDWAVEKLGIEVHDAKGQPTFFYMVLRNVVERIEISNMSSYFGKDSCEKWAKAIILGLGETMEEKGISVLFSSLGLEMDMRGGLGATLASTTRETLTNSLNDTEFVKKIEQTIAKPLCGGHITDILKTIKTKDKDKLVSGIETAADKDPGILSKVSSSGIMDVLTKTIAQ